MSWLGTGGREARSDVRARQLPGWLNAALVLGMAASMLWLERKRPLRASVERAARHETRNLVLAALSAVTIRLTEKPLVDRLSRIVHRKRWGLVRRLHLPPALEVLVAVVLLDYTLYVWHVLAHRVPFLWRLHRVHHADLDLTASTALRFHFAEMALSVPWRAGQVLLIGAAPLSLSVWQTATVLAILFHHSNVRLPLAVERRLCRLLMTPRMHGIHHSIVQDETNSNWSSGLTIWDWLHGTLRFDIPQDSITIGVPAYRDPDKVDLVEVLKMPFVEQPPTWLLPGNGQPTRTPLLSMRTE